MQQFGRFSERSGHQPAIAQRRSSPGLRIRVPHTLIGYATDIRMRAEIRAGELLAEMANKGERAVRKNMQSQQATSKLSDLGVTRTQSSRWQKLAALPFPVLLINILCELFV
jgi:hypothetical protein